MKTLPAQSGVFGDKRGRAYPARRADVSLYRPPAAGANRGIMKSIRGILAYGT